MSERIVSVDEGVDMVIRFYAEAAITFFPLLGVATGLVIFNKRLSIYPAVVMYVLMVLAIPACFVRLWLRYRGVQRAGGIFTRKVKAVSMAALLIPTAGMGGFIATCAAIGYYSAKKEIAAKKGAHQ